MVVVVGLEVVVNALVKVAGAENNQVNSLSHRCHDIDLYVNVKKEFQIHSQCNQNSK